VSVCERDRYGREEEREKNEREVEEREDGG